MKSDLILAVMKNVNVWDVECYVESLARSGYDGRKVFFVEGLADDARDLLTKNNFELVPFTTPAEAMSVHFQTSRYIPAAAYLEQHGNEFSRVMWTDVWDVVFQSDPFTWLDANLPSAGLVLAKEGWKIRDQAINDVWIRKLVSPSEYEYLREQEVLCAGTIVGSASVMTMLLGWISNWVRGSDSMQGLDQGMLNVLARRAPFKDWAKVPDPSQGFICTAGPFLAPSDSTTWTIEPPVFGVDGQVSTRDGQLFSILHQYNRHHGQFDPDGAYRSIVERRYR